VISVADPEMRHGRKSASRRFDGHKLDVMTDEATELVLAVAVRAGNGADQDGTLPLLEKVQKVAGVEVETLLGDMAYSDPELREATEEVGVDLVAKVPPVTNAGRFPKTDFSIDTAAASVTCPAGVTTTEAKREKDHKGGPGLRFVFSISACAACALRAKCVKGDTAGRSVFVSRHEDRMAAARAAEKDPETRALLRRRSKVERKIDHLQDLGMRKARYRGRRKTTLQALLAPTVTNFTRLCVIGAFATTATIATAARGRRSHDQEPSLGGPKGKLGPPDEPFARPVRLPIGARIGDPRSSAGGHDAHLLLTHLGDRQPGRTEHGYRVSRSRYQSRAPAHCRRSCLARASPPAVAETLGHDRFQASIHRPRPSDRLLMTGRLRRTRSRR